MAICLRSPDEPSFDPGTGIDESGLRARQHIPRQNGQIAIFLYSLEAEGQAPWLSIQARIVRFEHYDSATPGRTALLISPLSWRASVLLVLLFIKEISVVLKHYKW